MRTLEATDKILKEGVAKIILIGNEEEINKKAAEGGFDNFRCTDRRSGEI